MKNFNRIFFKVMTFGLIALLHGLMTVPRVEANAILIEESRPKLKSTAGNSAGAEKSIKNSKSLVAKTDSDINDFSDDTNPKNRTNVESSGAITHSGSSSIYLSAFKLRDERMAGAGLSVGGATGVLGAHMELNFDQENSVFTSFGAGSGYSTFSLAYKRSFEGEDINPYVKVGYARWYNSSGSTNGGDNSYVLRQFVSKEAMQSGHFGVNMAHVSVGGQYNLLSGEYTGLTFFAELTLLMGLDNQTYLPNGSLGSTYYF